MSDEDREKIMEKRASLRSWRERGGKMPRNVELIGAGLIAIIFLALIASSFMGVPQANNTTEQPKKTPVSTPAPVSAKSTVSLSPVSLPAPSININSPENITYNTSTPPLDFIVAGSNLDSVLLSVDGGPQVAIPHDGTIAKIDFAKGNPLFIDDFSGTTKGRWIESGDWKVEGGRYITSGGTSSFGNTGWDDYIVEAKTRVISGNNAGIGIHDDRKNSYYLFQGLDQYKTFRIVKFISGGSEVIQSTDASSVDPSQWHTITIISDKKDIIASIGGRQYLKYTDINNPYLKGGVILRSVDTDIEYDNVLVYKPLSHGTHNLTIIANNTAGNASSQTIYFSINASIIESGKEQIGKIGAPIVSDGLEINIKSVVPATQYTSVHWSSFKTTIPL